ncbi:MAG: ATP-binding protein [Myxococcota bacterium]
MKQNVVPRAAESDVVGDRVRLVTIGMLAVLAACAVFAVLRLVTTLADQRATPWYVNALGAVVMAVAFVWFRRAPARRSDVAVHVTAGTALVALVIPVAFGMSSSIWWLSLIAFAVLLMGHAVEGRIWAAAAVVTTIAFTLLEPSIQVEGAVPEPMSEVLASRVAFVAVLLVMAVAFRAEAERRARELSETADALQRAGQVKSRFLAHMSHEVRTPLHGVIASTSMALEEPLAPEARAHLEAAQQSAGLLLGMLSNLLDYARAEADALELRRVPFDLHATVSQLLAPLAAQALMRGLAFEATAAPGLPAKRLGDATRITQIVLNLVQNALKYTTSGGVKVRLAAGAGAADVVIEVEDSGPGIAEERLQEIFEPFIQLAPDDRGAFGGVGLGLAIVRETLRVMEGSVEVRSTVGQGATFVVTMPLPLVEGAAPGPTDLLAALPRLVREPAAGPTRPLRVLVAEDYPMNQRVMREMLERAHHTVRLVADGEEAWQVLQAESFDVLLSDVEMPRMGGLEPTARVRARELAEGGRACRSSASRRTSVRTSAIGSSRAAWTTT